MVQKTGKSVQLVFFSFPNVILKINYSKNTQQIPNNITGRPQIT
jgi:hypothetical protein